MFNSFLNCVIKNPSHFSSIDVTPSILTQCHIVCAVGGGVSVQQMDLWCVCVGQLGGVCSRWLCVVSVWDSWGSECVAGGFVLCVWDSWGSECAAGGFVVCVCVCVCV